MPYCGILDNMGSVDGKDVDLSRLGEGIILAGDEELDADDYISEEDKLDFFNETALRTKDALLKELDSLLGEIEGKSRGDDRHSPAFYERYKALVAAFRGKIEESTFPEKLEDWWRYEYEVRETGANLFLSHISRLSIGRNDDVDETTDTTFDILHVRAKLLTVDQYAQAYGVTATTVRQWIRRGKIRTAVKTGSEWRIPELAEIMTRGYTPGNYTRKEILNDLPEGYEFFNDYDDIWITQDEEQKEMFDVTFSQKHEISAGDDVDEIMKKYYKTIRLNQKEREKFELYLISNPLVEAQDSCLAWRGW